MGFSPYFKIKSRCEIFKKVKFFWIFFTFYSIKCLVKEGSVTLGKSYILFRGGIESWTVKDIWEGGVKKSEISGDVLYGWP